MIRITGGSCRGRKIQCPKGDLVRPTTSFVRESLFSILGPRLIGMRWLDVFAGCGIVGFEALSRGASSVLAIEKRAAHAKVIEANRDVLGLSESQHQTLCIDAMMWIKQQAQMGQWRHEPFDVMFLDPPFAMTSMDDWLTPCASVEGLLRPKTGVVVWEHRDPDPAVASGWKIIDKRQYSTSHVTWLQPEA